MSDHYEYQVHCKLLLILQALRMISIKILLVISMLFIKQISDES